MCDYNAVESFYGNNTYPRETQIGNAGNGLATGKYAK